MHYIKGEQLTMKYLAILAFALSLVGSAVAVPTAQASAHQRCGWHQHWVPGQWVWGSHHRHRHWVPGHCARY